MGRAWMPAGSSGRRREPLRAALLVMLLASLHGCAPAFADEELMGRAQKLSAELDQAVTEEGRSDGSPSLDQALEFIARQTPNETPLIFVTVNKGYIDFLENWFISVNKCGYASRVLFITEDPESHEYCLKRWASQTVSGSSIVGAGTPENNHAERSGEFLFNSDGDLDQVWLKDPFPYFTGNFDVWLASDGYSIENDGSPPYEEAKRADFYNVCTCTVMMKPNERTLQLVRQWIQAMDTAQSDGKVAWEQGTLNKLLYLKPPPGNVSVGILPMFIFPPGILYFDAKLRVKFFSALHEKGLSVAIAHNNFAVGKG